MKTKQAACRHQTFCGRNQASKWGNMNSKETHSGKRRTELMAATLRVIAAKGVKGATVRAIAKEAQVTQGLIRYYFATKEALIVAAYEKQMTDLIAIAAHDAHADVYQSARQRLAMFVQASVSPPVINPQVIALWAGFFQLLFHNEAMRASHKKTYHLLRCHIETLIAAVYREENRPIDAAQLRRLSIACNGVLDGLWMEGGIISDEFAANELVQTALEAFSALLGVTLQPAISDDLPNK